MELASPRRAECYNGEKEPGRFPFPRSCSWHGLKWFWFPPAFYIHALITLMRSRPVCQAQHSHTAELSCANVQVRNFYVGKDFKGDPPLHLKIAAGLTTGALGIMIASPTDLVKVSSTFTSILEKLCEGVCLAGMLCKWAWGYEARASHYGPLLGWKRKSSCSVELLNSGLGLSCGPKAAPQRMPLLAYIVESHKSLRTHDCWATAGQDFKHCPCAPAGQVRMQAEGKLPAGTPKRYPSAFKAYPTIVRCAAVVGLEVGYGGVSVANVWKLALGDHSGCYCGSAP
eukprot:1147342-Pelagomonas_calceolata.AAC.3